LTGRIDALENDDPADRAGNSGHQLTEVGVREPAFPGRDL
jgi:hypothetical protein